MCNESLKCGHKCKGVAGESRCLPCLNSECISKALRKQNNDSTSCSSDASEDSTRSDEEETNSACLAYLKRVELLASQSMLHVVSAEPTQFELQDEEMNETEKDFAFETPLLESAAETELCGICFTCELGEEACVRLGCGHVFHANCVKLLLGHKWTTLRISFGYLDCPACKQEISICKSQDVPQLSQLVNEALSFKAEIFQKAVDKAIEMGLDKEGRVVTEGDVYYNDLTGFAVHNCAFYQCYQCDKPYFGGMEDCSQAMNAENTKTKQDFICDPCAYDELGLGKEVCEEHGNEFVDWKCMYCCSVALFYCCGGTYKFCTPCHNDAMNGGKHKAQTDCTGGPNCPLGLKKHPNAHGAKASFPLGCSLCRSEKLEKIEQNEKASNGVNLEQRQDMKDRFDHVLGHGLEREMRVLKGKQVDEEGNPIE